MPNPSFARYYKTRKQANIKAGLGTAVGFDVAQTTSPDVTANSAETEFTLEKAGIWSIEAAVRVTGTVAGAPTWEAFCTIGPTAGDTNGRYTGQNGYANAPTSTVCLALSVVRDFAEGDTVAVNCFAMSENGGRFTFDVFDEQAHISLLYVGPS